MFAREWSWVKRSKDEWGRCQPAGSARLREVMRVNSARKICQEFFQEIGSSPRAARAAGLINASGCVRNHRTVCQWIFRTTSAMQCIFGERERSN